MVQGYGGREIAVGLMGGDCRFMGSGGGDVCASWRQWDGEIEHARYSEMRSSCVNGGMDA